MWSDIETDKKTHRACYPKDSDRSGVPTDFSKPVIRLTDFENRCYKASNKLGMEDKKILPFYFAVSCICTNFAIGNRLKCG